VDDGGLGEALGQARHEAAKSSAAAKSERERWADQGKTAAQRVSAAGRAYVAAAKQIGLSPGEFSIRSERRKRFSRAHETVWTKIPVYVVGGLHKIYVDPDGVVYSPRPTPDCAYGPHNLNSDMASLIVQEMASYLAAAERGRLDLGRG
jgi:hypothetical protein